MRGRELHPAVVWVAILVVVLAAGALTWRGSSPGAAEGGKPTERDKQLLAEMAAAREQAGIGRPAPATGK